MGRKTIKIDMVPYNFPTIFIGANNLGFQLLFFYKFRLCYGTILLFDKFASCFKHLVSETKQNRLPK
jgi:hypothetical protein